MLHILSRVLMTLLLIITAFVIFAIWASTPNSFPHFAVQTRTGLVRKEPTYSPNKLRLITYNIGYASGIKNNRANEKLTKEEVEKNLDEMVKTLSQYEPDILVLQEVDFNSARTFGINQMDVLANGLRLPYSAHLVNWNKKYIAWPYWPIQNQFGRMVSGQVILSRYPIIEDSYVVECFAKPKKNPFWYNMFYIDRCYQKADINLKGKKITVWNTHLEAFDFETKKLQTEKLAELVKSSSNNLTVVMGDFNSPSDFSTDTQNQKDLADYQQSKQLIEQFQKDSTLELAYGTFSFPSWKPETKIDHIFHNSGKLLKTPGLTDGIVSGTIGGLPASDHLPVWMDLHLE